MLGNYAEHEKTQGFRWGGSGTHEKPLPPAPFLLVAGFVEAGIGLIEAWIQVNSKTMLPKWALRHMVIDAKIVRYGRSAVVNIIEKHSKLNQKVIRMMPQRGLGPQFWFPERVWTSLLGL